MWHRGQPQSKDFMKKFAILAIASFLGACGGGGDGGGNSTVTPANPGTSPMPGGNNDPCLTLSPSALSLTATQGSATTAAVQATSTCNFPGIVNAAIIDSKGVFDPNAGISAASSSSYTAQLRTAQTLQAGVYDGTLEIRLCKDDPKVCAQPHQGSPWRLPYHLQVDPPVVNPSISWTVPNTQIMLANGSATMASLMAQTPVSLSGIAPVAWRASVAGAPWLKLVHGNGITNASSLQVAVDPAEFAKLDNFADHTALVTITADQPDVPPTTTAITLRKALPELTYAGPYTMLPGQSALLRLRGHGLSTLGDPAKSLQISGVNVSNVQVINDSEITVLASAGSAGAARFSIPNAMGIDTGGATVKIVSPTQFGYQAFATDGEKGTLRYDVERQSLLLVNRAQQKVLRYAFIAGRWATASVAIKGVDDASLSPDGQSLVVTSTSGLLSLLDPATLALQASYQSTAYLASQYYVTSRLAITNDGRAWFPQGHWLNTLAYFDLRKRQFGRNGDDYYDGPWFSLSGDGERLVMIRSASPWPTGPVQYMDASDGAIHHNPDTNLSMFHTSSQSRDGDRIIFDDLEVRDRQFKKLGRFAVNDVAYAGLSPGSVISPDGTRAYVMYLGPLTDPDMKPRIFVFDTSKAVEGVFPVVGSFSVSDTPTSCMRSESYCDPRMSTAISPDSKTLFFAGNKNVLVIPVPGSLAH